MPNNDPWDSQNCQFYLQTHDSYNLVCEKKKSQMHINAFCKFVTTKMYLIGDFFSFVYLIFGF